MNYGRARARAIAWVPVRFRLWVRRQQRTYRLQGTRVGTVEWGGMRRLTPISGAFGLDRGLTIERYYIESFLALNRNDIRGRVLEMGDPDHTHMFGGERVTHSDVMHYVPGNPRATLVADLTRRDNLPSNTFDCIILTQTLQMIYDQRAAIENLHWMLKPGGILLVSTHGISRIARREGIDPWGEYWHMTGQSANRLFREFFPASQLHVQVYGNVLTATASLHGLAISELEKEELDYLDPNYELIVAIRAVKPTN